MDDVASLSYLHGRAGAGLLAAARRRLLAAPAAAADAAQPGLHRADAGGSGLAAGGGSQQNSEVPAFYRRVRVVDGAHVASGRCLLPCWLRPPPACTALPCPLPRPPRPF